MPLDRLTRLKYRLYERAVQTPSLQAEWLDLTYFSLRKRSPRILREDFCGSFAVACEWVKRSPRNRALALDLDPLPLSYGAETHWRKLRPAARARLRAQRKSVLSVTRPGADVIVAGNFSFNIFKTDAELAAYFRYVRRSLAPGGIFVMEAAGGPGMVAPGKESKRVKDKRGKYEFTYTWDQQEFDPITHHARYAIHFSLAGGKKITEAFTYDWRLWSIPELRRLLTEAGFKRTGVYWDESRPKEDDLYVRRETAENAYAWLAYVVGEK